MSFLQNHIITECKFLISRNQKYIGFHFALSGGVAQSFFDILVARLS